MYLFSITSEVYQCNGKNSTTRACLFRNNKCKIEGGGSPISELCFRHLLNSALQSSANTFGKVSASSS